MSTNQKIIREQIILSQELPDRIGKSVAKEIRLASLKISRVEWITSLDIDLSKARSTPERIVTYDKEADCILYLPDSTGFGTIYVDSIVDRGYPIGSVYYRIKERPFTTIFLKNDAQSGAWMYLKVGKGDFDIEKPVISPAKTYSPYTVEMVHAGEVYSQVLPNFTRYLRVQTTDLSPFKLSFAQTDIEKYEEVPSGLWERDKLFLVDKTIYLIGYEPGKIAQIFAWT